MQVSNTAALPNAQTCTATTSDAAASGTVEPGAGSSNSAPLANSSSNAPAVTVSLSAAAQAYLSQPDPPSIEETQRAKKKPKIKTLLEMMLEWGRKYEEQRDQQQKDKQLAASQGVAPANAALTTNSPKKATPGMAVGGDTDAK
jgi:hypothetical protein